MRTRSPVDFNPRFPRGKRRERQGGDNMGNVISIHASRGGSDPKRLPVIAVDAIFQSTLPAGEATLKGPPPRRRTRGFQSTLPAGEATKNHGYLLPSVHISIHASRGESDEYKAKTKEQELSFQSTLPAGEATYRCGACSHPEVISIHASRGGSDPTTTLTRCPWRISIHASRGGSDEKMK